MISFDSIARVFSAETIEIFESAGELDIAGPEAIIASAIETLDDLTRAVVVAAIVNAAKDWERNGSTN